MLRIKSAISTVGSEDATECWLAFEIRVGTWRYFRKVHAGGSCRRAVFLSILESNDRGFSEFAELSLRLAVCVKELFSLKRISFEESSSANCLWGSG